MTSPRELLAEATERLAAAGIDSPRVDAELLLAAAIGAPRSSLLTCEVVATPAVAVFAGWIRRRIGREPLQHITGTAPFRHLEIAVGPGVFVPRPETELLVDAVLPHLRAIERPVVVDLCSGSGALALAIADEAPAAGVVAVESSFAAVRWLTRNTAGTRVRVIPGDIRDPELLRSLYGRADAVVCNPPYVPLPTDIAPEVRADPHEAVFAGADGLDLMSTVIIRAALLLRPGGVFAVEHDDSHGAQVAALFGTDGRWDDITGHRDLTGRPRYATAVRA